MKRLLLCPGLGDCHWALLKLQSWLRRRGWDSEPPEVHVWDIDGRPRALDYLKYLPWLRVGGYFRQSLVGEASEVFHDLYFQKHPTDSVLGALGFDAVIGVNGNMRNGVPFASLMEGAEVNYGYGPLGVLRDCRRRSGYIICCFSDHAMFGKSWTPVVTADVVRTLLVNIRREFPRRRFIFTGCSWDRRFSSLCAAEGDEFLIDQTSLPEMLGLLRGADGCIGWCNGVPIVAQHMGIPTVMWWSRKYFPLHDRLGWATPHERLTYLPLDVEDYHPDRTPQQIISFLRGDR